MYGCADCSGCEHKARCLYKYDAGKNAKRNNIMKINEQWEELKEESHANIQSEKGILIYIKLPRDFYLSRGSFVLRVPDKATCTDTVLYKINKKI